MIFNQYTVAELEDLLKAKDYAFAQLRAAFDGFGSSWQDSDSAAFNDWLHDWTAINDRYALARRNAQNAIDGASSIVSHSVILADGQYKDVLATLSANPQAMGQTKGDFQDLNDRLAAAIKKPIAYPNMPQPTSTDIDLVTYQAAGKAVKGIETAAKAGMSTGGKVAIGVGIGLAAAVGLKALL